MPRRVPADNTSQAFRCQVVDAKVMTSSDHGQVRENLLIEGLMDAISLGNAHTAFMYDNHSPKRPLHEAQALTLDTIRELVSEGLFVLGVPTRQGGFDAWELPLDVAMAKIEDSYVKNFDDRWGWTTMVWMDQTEKGKKLAMELYHTDDPDHSGHQTPQLISDFVLNRVCCL